MKKCTLYFFLILLTIIGCKPENPSKRQYVLWYDEPAVEWTEALPVGNGRLGGMVFGDPSLERIQLNEESLWGGQK
jgi:alpha-L-fucosidase 2